MELHKKIDDNCYIEKDRAISNFYHEFSNRNDLKILEKKQLSYKISNIVFNILLLCSVFCGFMFMYDIILYIILAFIFLSFIININHMYMKEKHEMFKYFYINKRILRLDLFKFI